MSLIVICSFAIALIFLEALVRVGGETDADGQFTFLGYTLQPYVVPVNQLRVRIDDYIENQEFATVIADEWLGWTYRPNWTWNDGEFTINSAGLRARREYSLTPRARYPAHRSLWRFLRRRGGSQGRRDLAAAT